ncbi:MAG: hypothetical protein KKE57_09980 [Proteobacteria bacterium]|nr:hypothetical protein [Pseudomonadota bacterium]
MGLRSKILSGFLILSTMLLIAGIWSVYEARSLGASVQKILDDNYRSIDAAKTMIEALEREDSGVLLLLSGKWEKGRSIIESADSLFQHGFKIAQGNVTIPGEQGYVDAVESRYRAYKDMWLRPIVGTRHEADLDWYLEKVHQAFLDAKESVNALMALNQETMYQTASDLKNRAHRATMPGIVAIVAALAFTFIFNYFVNFYIVSPIIKMTKGIRKFIETREPITVQIETNDELTHLAASIQDLAERLRADGTEK